MGTTVKQVLNMMLPLIPDDLKTGISNDYSLAKHGLVEMGVAIGKNFVFSGEGENEQIDVELPMAELYLSSYFTYRCYLMRLKDELNQNAVNFSTLTFSIKSLEQRPKSVDDSIYAVNRYLNDEIARVLGASGVVGFVTQFGRS